MRNEYTVWLEILKESEYSEDLDVDGIMTLDLKKQMEEFVLDSRDSRRSLVACFCQHGNEPLGSIKAGNSLISVTLLSVYQKKKK
jgi:hypothetical protein